MKMNVVRHFPQFLLTLISLLYIFFDYTLHCLSVKATWGPIVAGALAYGPSDQIMPAAPVKPTAE